MTEEQKSLREKMQAVDLNGPDAKPMLERFLRSVARGSMDGHQLTASAIYGVADDLDEPDRSLLLEQMFLTLMRALEDYATLCLMWLSTDKHPLDAFLSADKTAIRQFYARTRKGIGDEAMFRIFGLAGPEMMKSKGLVNPDDHYMLESVLSWAHDKYTRLLSAFGRVYHSTVDEADELIGAWQISYAMSAMGTKMILDEQGKPEELVLGMGEGGSSKSLFSAPVSVDARFGEETLHHVLNVCKQIRDLAQIQLGLLRDPTAGLGRTRKDFESEFKGLAKDEEVGVPVGLKIVRATGPAGTVGGQVAGEVQEIKPEDEKKASEQKGIQKTVETGGGLKITHTKPLKDDDEEK